MGWTVNQSRRRSRLRHRPHLEHLDDRCLLTTGLGIQSTHAVTEVRAHKSSLVRTGDQDVSHAKGAHHLVRYNAAVAKHRERPAGTLTAGAASTAYDPIIGAAQVRSSYNVDGSGMTVAVIDTGVDYNNSALGGSFGPGSKVIAGYDFADNSSDPMATTSQHGTAVAGLIGSDNPSDPGVAPGVDIVALRVTDGTNSASLSSIANALQWVIDNHAQYNITAVNMSLSDGNNYAQNWFATTGGGGPAEQVTNLIGQLTAMNIPVVAATGNNFNGQQGEGFAAIVASTISVTATDLSGNLLSNAQRLGSSIGGASSTTIAAPGEGLTAPSGDSGTSTVEGTSFATPLVTGSVVLLQQIYESRFGSLPTVAQLKSWIEQGSDPINDPVTGITIGELDVPKAAALIPQPSSNSTPVPMTTTSTVSTVTPSTSVVTVVTTNPTPTPSAPDDHKRPGDDTEPEAYDDRLRPLDDPGGIQQPGHRERPGSDRGIEHRRGLAFQHHLGPQGAPEGHERLGGFGRPLTSDRAIRWTRTGRQRSVWRFGQGPAPGLEAPGPRPFRSAWDGERTPTRSTRIGRSDRLVLRSSPRLDRCRRMNPACGRLSAADTTDRAGLLESTLAPGGDSLGLDFENGPGHGGGEWNRPEHHGHLGRDGAARGTPRPRPRETRAGQGRARRRKRFGLRRRVRHQRSVRREGGRGPDHQRLRWH